MTAAIHGLSHKGLKHFRKNPAALAVYWVYISRTNPEGVAYPSIIGLWKDVGYCKATCQKSRDWLVSIKALERVENYVRPEWRELEEKDKKRKVNLDKAEYYRVTGYIEIDGERTSMLYYGSLEKSDIDYTNNDVLSGTTSDAIGHRSASAKSLHDVLSGRTPTPSNVETVEEELNTLKELNTKQEKDSAPENGAVTSNATSNTVSQAESAQPAITQPSEQKQVDQPEWKVVSKKKDKKPPSVPRVSPKRPRNPLMDVMAECAYGITPGTPIPDEAGGHLAKLVKAAMDAFRVIYQSTDSDKLANAIRIFYRDHYPVGGKLTPVRSVPQFGAQFLAFIQSYQKPKTENGLYTMPELPPSIVDTPEFRAQRKADLEALKRGIAPEGKIA